MAKYGGSNEGVFQAWTHPAYPGPGTWRGDGMTAFFLAILIVTIFTLALVLIGEM
jgi:hypothetical protein